MEMPRILKVVDAFGLQDIVVANRFLCHIQPEEAEACLRNVARLVKPGGYLFVSGVDLGVRTKVARDLGCGASEPVNRGNSRRRRVPPPRLALAILGFRTI